MSGHFSVRVDPAHDLIHLTLQGFLASADAAAFGNEFTAAHAQLACAANQHVTLCDISALKVQPQEVVAAFQALLAAPRWQSRRLAFVLQGTLARGQLRRALGGRPVSCFDDVRSAERWLLAPDAASEAA